MNTYRIKFMDDEKKLAIVVVSPTAQVTKEFIVSSSFHTSTNTIMFKYLGSIENAPQGGKGLSPSLTLIAPPHFSSDDIVLGQTVTLILSLDDIKFLAGLLNMFGKRNTQGIFKNLVLEFNEFDLRQAFTKGHDDLTFSKNDIKGILHSVESGVRIALAKLPMHEDITDKELDDVERGVDIAINALTNELEYLEIIEE